MFLTNQSINGLRQIQTTLHCHNVNVGWWDDTPDVNARVPEKLCLIHSEISEAMEGHRKNLMDDKIPNRKMIEVELADAVIRILDLGGALKLDIAGAIEDKFEFNKTRADHKRSERSEAHGKRY